MTFKSVKKMDINFSVIGYGCWGASGESNWHGHTDKDQIRAIQTAIDGGINFFDAAPVYGLGYAETILGKAIKGRRNNIYIGTKCGLPWDEKNNVRNDVRKDVILKEIDESLLRLDVDYVDIYQVHWPTANGVAIEETMSALAEIIKSGKARYVGLTNFSIADAKKSQEYIDIASMQGLYNMIERNAESYHNIPLQYKVEAEVLPFTRTEGMAFFPYSPLFQGLLSGKFTADQAFMKGDVRKSNPKLVGAGYAKHFELVKRLNSFADKLGKPLNEVALNWLVEQEEVTSIIAGVKNEEQVKSNLKALEWKLDADAIAQINNIVDTSEL
ncbi:MAG: aldo/keto reductase [Firmicutes bacterium]|nr:aldo/keto reductase [Bacillota bacterium]